MMRRWLVFRFEPLAALLALVALLTLTSAPKVARADAGAAHSVTVAVLAFDSDDAEEQAEALTSALRSRVRASQGWSLIDTTQTLGMLTAALRCPGKPLSIDCQQKVAEQLKLERYVFGYVTRGPQAGQVTADIHLYQRGKPETVIKESYTDNLKDQNDDTLRKIAQRALDRLGASALGTVLVRATEKDGEIVVDGEKKVPLKDNAARIELAPGSHAIELTAGGSTQKRTVLVVAGKEAVVEMTSAPPPVAAAPEKPFPTRKVVGGAIAAAGIAVGVVSLINFIAYQDDLSKGDELQTPQLRFLPGVTPSAEAACNRQVQTADISRADGVCRTDDDASRHGVTSAVTAGVAGVLLLTGAYFLFTDGSSDKERKAERKTRVTPTFGQNGGGLFLSGSF